MSKEYINKEITKCLEKKDIDVELSKGIYIYTDGNDRTGMAGSKKFKECSKSLNNRCGSTTCPYSEHYIER